MPSPAKINPTNIRSANRSYFRGRNTAILEASCISQADQSSPLVIHCKTIQPGLGLPLKYLSANLATGYQIMMAKKNAIKYPYKLFCSTLNIALASVAKTLRRKKL